MKKVLLLSIVSLFASKLDAGNLLFFEAISGERAETIVAACSEIGGGSIEELALEFSTIIRVSEDSCKNGELQKCETYSVNYKTGICKYLGLSGGPGMQSYAIMDKLDISPKEERSFGVFPFRLQFNVGFSILIDLPGNLEVRVSK